MEINGVPLSRYTVPELELMIEDIEYHIGSRPVTEDDVLRATYTSAKAWNVTSDSYRKFADMVKSDYPELLKNAVEGGLRGGIPIQSFTVTRPLFPLPPAPPIKKSRKFVPVKPIVMVKCGLCKSDHDLHVCVNKECGYKLCGGCVGHRSSYGNMACVRCDTEEFGSGS